MVGWLAGWVVGGLVGWLAGWVVSLLVGWLGGWVGEQKAKKAIAVAQHSRSRLSCSLELIQTVVRSPHTTNDARLAVHFFQASTLGFALEVQNVRH